MKTKQWSEIHLEFLFDSYCHDIHLNDDGVLNVINYGKVVGESGPEYTANLTKIPLK